MVPLRTASEEKGAADRPADCARDHRPMTGRGNERPVVTQTLRGPAGSGSRRNLRRGVLRPCRLRRYADWHRRRRERSSGVPECAAMEQIGKLVDGI